MNLLKINNLQKTFGGNLLFDKVSLEMNHDDKVALIGRNGTGKSTLIKCILGDITPDSGDIFIFGDTKIGYLSQDVLSKENHTLIDEMHLVFKDVLVLEEKLHQISNLLITEPTEDNIKRYADLEERYRHLGGYDYPTFIDMILTKFGFTKEEYTRYISTFSGGEKTRVAFAKLLIMKPDILLLDEPTNHMDIDIIEWLEDYLRHYPGAVLVVTHDKYFINKIVNKIFEMDQDTLHTYYGKFDDYEVEKVKRYELLMKQYLRQNKEIEHLQSFVDRFRYKATKAKSAQDRIKKINRIERLDKPTNSESHVKMTFHSKRPTDAVIIKATDLSIGYDMPLFDHIDFEMRGYEKLAIIGPNGVGKTTLVKTIIDEIPSLNGELEFLKNIKVGYFDQNQAFTNETLTLFDYVHNIYPMKTSGEVRGLLAKVLFTAEDVFKTINVLSGGEKVRLRLLLLMLEEPELLILDEPTNHLDIDTKTIVEDIFSEYIGPIIFISHDRYFINKVATKIIRLEPGEFTLFDGNYDEYIASLDKQEKIVVKKEKKERKPSIQKELLLVEKEIEKLEKEMDEYHQLLFSSDVYSSKEEYSKIENLINETREKLELLLEKYMKLSTDETS
ncbi:MAG: ribosomal protection-like ABC-F family protein [Candidatus Izemoplasmatales bacterium]